MKNLHQKSFYLFKKGFHNYFTHIRFVFLSQLPFTSFTDIQAFCKRNYEYSL